MKPNALKIILFLERLLSLLLAIAGQISAGFRHVFNLFLSIPSLMDVSRKRLMFLCVYRPFQTGLLNNKTVLRVHFLKMRKQFLLHSFIFHQSI